MRPRARATVLVLALLAAASALTCGAIVAYPLALESFHAARLRSGDESVRLAALAVLSRHGTLRTIPAVVEMLERGVSPLLCQRAAEHVERFLPEVSDDALTALARAEATVSPVGLF